MNTERRQKTIMLLFFLGHQLMIVSKFKKKLKSVLTLSKLSKYNITYLNKKGLVIST